MTSSVEALTRHEEPWVVTIPGFGGDNSGDGPPVATDQVPERDRSRALREFVALWSLPPLEDNLLVDNSVGRRVDRLFDVLSIARISPYSSGYLEGLAGAVLEQVRSPESELPLVSRYRGDLERVFVDLEPSRFLEEYILSYAKQDPLGLFAKSETENVFLSWESHIRSPTFLQ